MRSRSLLTCRAGFCTTPDSGSGTGCVPTQRQGCGSSDVGYQSSVAGRPGGWRPVFTVQIMRRCTQRAHWHVGWADYCQGRVPLPGSVRVQQLPVRNRLVRRCPPVFLSRPETRAFPPRIAPQSPRAGSRRTRPFHGRGSAAHFGSAGWLAPRPRRPASRTPVQSLRHGSSGPLPPSPGP
jgi:hypothetical protein